MAGCDWLLANWAELSDRLDEGLSWQPEDRMRAIRMLGKQPLNLVVDEPVMVDLPGDATRWTRTARDVFDEPLSRPAPPADRRPSTERLAGARSPRAGCRSAARTRAARRCWRIVSERARARLEELLALHVERGEAADLGAPVRTAAKRGGVAPASTR